MRAIALLPFVIFASILSAQVPKSSVEGMKIIFSDSFSEKSLGLYQFSDSSQWVVTKNGKSGKDMKCMGGGADLSKTFIPSEMALIKGLEVGDFVMEFDFVQRGKDFNLRDVCVIYGYADANTFYFAQAASEETKYTHNTFSVENGKPRKIGTSRNQGVLWDYEKWQSVVLVRQTATRSVQLYVDGQLVVETAADEGRSGLIGIGTFGSEFKVDNLKVWAPDNK
ncbi:MAG: hypothetical protein QM786_18175 [Breznakibacter sp.]